MHRCMNAWTSARKYVTMHACVDASADTHACWRMYAYMYTYMYTYMHMRVRAYACALNAPGVPAA